MAQRKEPPMSTKKIAHSARTAKSTKHPPLIERVEQEHYEVEGYLGGIRRSVDDLWFHLEETTPTNAESVEETLAAARKKIYEILQGVRYAERSIVTASLALRGYQRVER
jgi:hypothetical protein